MNGLRNNRRCKAPPAVTTPVTALVARALDLAKRPRAPRKRKRNCAEATQRLDVLGSPKRAKMGTVVGINRRQNPSGLYRTAPPVDLTSGSSATFKLAGHVDQRPRIDFGRFEVGFP